MQKESLLKQYIQPSLDSQIETIISRIIIDFGIPPHIRGYQYVREALLMLMEDKNNLFCITKNMYPEIARKYYTTPPRVERGIRHAAEVSWEGLGINSLKSYLPDSSERPSNSVFLDFMHRWICSAIEKP